MKRVSKSEGDSRWLKALGKHVESLIREKGYKSQYDFWINKAGDDLSRSAISSLLSGRHDPKATTLRTFAKLLNIDISQLFRF